VNYQGVDKMQYGMKVSLSLALLCSLALIGCGGTTSDYGDAEAAEKVESVAPEALEVTPELEVILAAADGADGASDHVVSQCTNCALAMEGVADHATTVGDYELHFCSDGCLKDFSSHSETRLLALNVGDAEAAADQVETP
jgi:hypothetical protein